MAAIGRMVVFSGITVAVSLIAPCIFPQRFLYSIGIGGALVALSSAAVCLLFLPAMLALLGTGSTRWPRPAPGASQRAALVRLARFVLTHRSASRSCVDRGDGLRRAAVPAGRADPGERADPAPGRQRPSGRRGDRRELRLDPADSDRRGRVERGPVQIIGGASSTSQRPAIGRRRARFGVGHRLVQASTPSSASTRSPTGALTRCGECPRPALGRADAGRRPAGGAGRPAHSLGAHLPWRSRSSWSRPRSLLFVMTGSVVLPLVALRR